MAVGADGRWTPGIGDPTLGGWITAAGYFVAAALAARAAWRQGGDRTVGASERRKLLAFWGLTAVAMALLGVNKQLDLQSWLTEAMRDLSRAQGWYESRRRYQLAFILLLGGAGTVAIMVAAVVFRSVLRRIAVALVGLGVLGTFVVMRAASFHHVDMLLHGGPLPLNWVVELGSVLLIAVSAWFAGRLRA